MSTVVQSPSKSRGQRHTLLDRTVSLYERVASLLLALVVMAGMAVAILFLVWLTTQIFVAPLALPVLYDDLGGGDPEGVLGETLFIEGPPDEEIAEETDLEEPKVEEVVALITDAVATRQADLDDPTLEQELESSGHGGSEGTGNARPLGEGSGDNGGVARPFRWIIRYDKGGTLDDYARQLQFFGIELGVVGGTNQIVYASNVASNPPQTYTQNSAQEKRLYFSWRDGALQQADRELLSRAGVQTAGRIVLQFYTPERENELANLEMNYLQSKHPGRDLRQVRRTHFVVEPQGGGYAFVVVDQTYF